MTNQNNEATARHRVVASARLITRLGRRDHHARSASSQLDSETRLKRLLVVIDGSETIARVLEYVTNCAYGAQINAVLLYVDSEPNRNGAAADAMSDREGDLGGSPDDCRRRALRSAADRLGLAGIVHRERIEIGDPGMIIVKCAAEEQCDLIVLADPDGVTAALSIERTGPAIRSVLK